MPKRPSAVVNPIAQPRGKRTKQATTTSDDAPQPVETSSKKRGRPRKESLAANNSQLSSAKKRGRPARESNIGANEQPSALKKRGRPAKDSSVLPRESASKEAAQNVETPSKKRGRPAKNAPAVESGQPSSAKKRGRPVKDASSATPSKTTSPTKRGRPIKETATATSTPVKTTETKTKSTPTKKTGVQPAKKGRPSKTKAAVVASTAKSGTRGAKPSAKKARPQKKTESFPSKIGDVLQVSSPYIEGHWPDLAEALELKFLPDTENKILWGRYDIGISEGYLRHEGLKLKKKMEFQYRGRAVNTGDGDRGVFVVEFKGQNFTATFSHMTGNAPVQGVMDTKLSQSSSHTWYYENGWENYAKDIWGK